MKYDVTITVGQNVGDTHKLDTPTICAAFVDMFGIEYYTAMECAGMYRTMREASTRIEICDIDASTVKAIREGLPGLASSLDQECIALSIRETAFQLVYAPEYSEEANA